MELVESTFCFFELTFEQIQDHIANEMVGLIGEMNVEILFVVVERLGCEHHQFGEIDLDFECRTRLFGV